MFNVLWFCFQSCVVCVCWGWGSYTHEQSYSWRPEESVWSPRATQWRCSDQIWDLNTLLWAIFLIPTWLWSQKHLAGQGCTKWASMVYVCRTELTGQTRNNRFFIFIFPVGKQGSPANLLSLCPPGLTSSLTGNKQLIPQPSSLTEDACEFY